MGKPFEDFGDDFQVHIPSPKSALHGGVIPPEPTRYGPVIKALKQLVKAFEVLDNSQIVSQHKERAKKRWAGKSPEEKRANTAAARAAKK